jgi:arylsulfatase A-like enzyme
VGAPSGVLDMPSTLLGLMDLDVPDNWQGKNLAPAILNGDDAAVDSVPIFNFKPSWRGVYTKRYTFAFENIERTRDISSRFGSDLPDRRKHTQNHNVLYDRETDPLQLNNLVNSTEHIPLAMELTEATHDWLEVFNDPFLSYRRLIEVVGEQEDPPPIELIADE